VEKNSDIPEAEEVTIELIDTGVDKTELRSIALRLKKYLYSHNEIVEGGYRCRVPMTIIIGVHDPHITDLVEVLVKSTKPNGEVQITGRTRVVVEARSYV